MSSSAACTPSQVLIRELESEVAAPVAPRQPFRRGHTLGRQGEPSERLYLILQGRVMLRRQSLDGSSYAVYLLGPGDVLGESALGASGRWEVTATAVTDGVARVIHRSNIRRLAQLRPELIEALMGLLSARVERSYRRFDVLMNSAARDRVLALLTLMGDYHGERCGDEVWLPLTLSQAQFGEMVGLARETVARVFAGLEDEGLIRRANRRGLWLRLPDQDALPAL